VLLLGTGDGVLLSAPETGPVTLEWILHALLASHYLEVPILPCPEDWDVPHILGPGVSILASHHSVPWCWMPHDSRDLDLDRSDRVASLAGPNCHSRLGWREDLYVTGPAPLLVRDLGIDTDPVRGGTAVVLREEDWGSAGALSERGYRVVPEFWSDRSRDPLEEVRERLDLIIGADRVISSAAVALGVAQAWDIPYSWCGDPASLPFLEHFAYHGCHDPTTLSLAGLLEPARPVESDDALYKFSSRAAPVGADFCLISRF
jgi:hypothetical protein